VERPSEAIVQGVLESAYGLSRAAIRPIGYGLINWLARVDAEERSYVVKRYTPAYFRGEDIERSVDAQLHCSIHEAPVPAPVPNRHGKLITRGPDAAYVLFPLAVGRHLPRGAYSLTAARSLGEAVGRVGLALADWGQERPSPWTLRAPEEIVNRFEHLLAVAERGATELDRRVVRDVRFRLAYLNRHPDAYAQISGTPAQWIHGDFLDTNVLFGADDRVCAVVDFDNIRILPRGFDFMWALTHCVTPIAPERDSFLQGYRAAVQPSRDELVTYVPLWTYTAVGDIWPLEIRYLEPERFDPRWEGACWTPFLSDRWEAEMEAVAAWLMKR
jgi:Ser/Thr protein kinase RdoA (MazF antagonist)